jgi:N-acetyl-gamma-glutamyl-phosphate reductase
VGVTGYSGREADRILAHHPSVKVTGRFASKSDGQGIEAYSLEAVKRAVPDVVITATEHDISMGMAPDLLDAGFRVIDMSGAFCMKDPALYPTWYGFEHTAPGLLERAVYGMTDLLAEKIKGAKRIRKPDPGVWREQTFARTARYSNRSCKAVKLR